MMQKEAIKSKIWVILQEEWPGFSTNKIALKKKGSGTLVYGSLKKCVNQMIWMSGSYLDHKMRKLKTFLWQLGKGECWQY